MNRLIEIWRVRAATLRKVAKLVKDNKELAKGLNWMADGFDQAATELEEETKAKDAMGSILRQQMIR